MDTLEKYSWLRKINKTLLTLDELPLLRTYAPFNFDEFSNHLTKKFSLKSVKIEPSEMKWLKADELKQGFSDNVNYLSFVFSNLDGNVYLLMDLEDISKITNEFISQSSQIKLTTTLLEESYFRYISLETLNILSEMNLFQDLSAKMVEITEPLKEDSLCLDIKININDISIYARIAITPKFRKAWENHFISNPPLKAEEISKELQLTMSAEIGSVNLNYETLKKIQIGDFVILDKINYDAKTNKGQVTLKLGDTELFLAKVKQNKLKIIDFVQYSEETSMEKKPNEKPIESKEKPVAEKKPEAEEKVEVEEKTELQTSQIENMPITIIVEAARFKITLDKLMSMQPGNLLDLAVHPEKAVNLVVNGQQIAKGELVNLGDTLGVRILEMG
ncbi:MAG TPA: YscQ/HrcQ family type III secretion apparatus protein [Chlamydiae bacterium]|nr:YscQ/HrcQ family type III secretion apparatus protein [Chlamydiota bacterium]